MDQGASAITAAWMDPGFTMVEDRGGWRKLTSLLIGLGRRKLFPISKGLTAHRDGIDSLSQKLLAGNGWWPTTHTDRKSVV